MGTSTRRIKYFVFLVLKLVLWCLLSLPIFVYLYLTLSENQP